MCQYPCTDISEIAAWHTDHRRIFFIGPLLVCKEIIELLRQPSCHIDRVGRCKKKLLVEGCICKSLLYQLLAIIKCAFHFKCMDILSQCGQLLFLHRAYFTGWIKYHHFY